MLDLTKKSMPPISPAGSRVLFASRLCRQWGRDVSDSADHGAHIVGGSKHQPDVSRTGSMRSRGLVVRESRC